MHDDLGGQMADPSLEACLPLTILRQDHAPDPAPALIGDRKRSRGSKPDCRSASLRTAGERDDEPSVAMLSAIVDWEKTPLTAAARRASDDAARQREMELRAAAATAAKDGALKRKLAGRRSGKPPSRAHRNPVVDEQIAKAIQRSVLSGDIVRLSRKGGGAVTDWRVDKRTKRTPTLFDPLDEPVEYEATFWTPTWDHAGEHLKQLAWAFAATGMHSPYAFTAHLGAEVVARGRASGRPLATYIQEELRRHLRRAFGAAGLATPDFFFAVEASVRVKPHLHGVMVLSRDDAVTLAKTAIRAACGEWRSATRQVDFQPLRTPGRWVDYLSKWRRITKLLLGDTNVVGATQGIRRAAKVWYEAKRRGGSPVAPLGLREKIERLRRASGCYLPGYRPQRDYVLASGGGV